VAIVVSTQATVAEPIVSPPVYVVPSTGTSVTAEVLLRKTTLAASVVGGVVYARVTWVSPAVAVGVEVLLLWRIATVVPVDPP
jgi:hypothetical protein